MPSRTPPLPICPRDREDRGVRPMRGHRCCPPLLRQDLKALAVVIWFVVVKRQRDCVADPRVELVKLDREVLPVAAELHNRHNRPKMLAQLWIADVRRETLKILVLASSALVLRCH